VTITTTGADLAAAVARNLGRAGGVVSLSGLRASAACVDGALRVTLSRAAGNPVGPAERLTLITSEFLATAAPTCCRRGSRPRPARRPASPSGT
jgi:hypothetical protein